MQKQWNLSSLLMMLAQTLIVVAPIHAALASTTYRVTDLGTLGGQYSFASAINDLGVVTGDAYLANGQVNAYVYADAMVGIGHLGAGFSYSAAINNASTVVGYSVTPASEFRAFYYDNSGIQDLDIPTRLNIATGINDSNQISGYLEG